MNNDNSNRREILERIKNNPMPGEKTYFEAKEPEGLLPAYIKTSHQLDVYIEKLRAEFTRQQYDMAHPRAKEVR